MLPPRRLSSLLRRSSSARRLCSLPRPQQRAEEPSALSDLQVHQAFERECKAMASRDEEVGLFWQLQHPLLLKYNFSFKDFCINATDAVNNLFGVVHTSNFRNFSGEDLSFLHGVCSTQATSVLNDVMRGYLSIDDIHSRKKKDLEWFQKFGLYLDDSLVVQERQVSFAYLSDVIVHISNDPSPTEENVNCVKEVEKSEDFTHVLVEANVTFQLRSVATLSYIMPGPPPYHLNEIGEDSLSLLHTRFIGCVSSGDEQLNWKISRLSVTQVHPPTLQSFFSSLKKLIS